MTKRMKIRVNKAEAAERVKRIWPILKRTYPKAAIALKFVNPLELLIAVDVVFEAFKSFIREA